MTYYLRYDKVRRGKFTVKEIGAATFDCDTKEEFNQLHHALSDEAPARLSRINLSGMDFDAVMRGLLEAPTHPTNKKAKRVKRKNARSTEGR